MPDLAIHRLYTQQIEQPRAKTPQDIVGWFGAIQGQDYASALWSLALRMPGSTEADIERAVTDGRIVRTSAMRGTLFMVAAADIRWLMAFIGPRVRAWASQYYGNFGLDEETMQRSNALLVDALRERQPRARNDLLAHLEQHGIPSQASRGSYMLHRASHDGLICQNAVVRGQPTFMLLDDSVALPNTLSPDEAAAELAYRYFTGRGPATVHDFAWWSSLPITEARAALDSVKSRLVEDTIDGKSYWRSPDVEPGKDADVHFLPGFDEYLLGYKDRDASIDKEHEAIWRGKNAIFRPTVIIDGRAVAFWKRTVKKDTVHVEINPFAPLPADRSDAITAAAERYAAFLSKKLAISF